MEKQLIEVEVATGTYALGQHLAKFVSAVKQSLADGWQPGTDIPALISSAVEDLVPAVSDASKVAAEAEDKQAFVNAIYLGLSPVAFSFLKKD